MPIPILMLMGAVLLVILPLIEAPVDSVAAFGIILLGVPVYFIFIFPYKFKPTIFSKVNGMYIHMKYVVMYLNKCVQIRYNYLCNA